MLYLKTLEKVGFHLKNKLTLENVENIKSYFHNPQKAGNILI